MLTGTLEHCLDNGVVCGFLEVWDNMVVDMMDLVYFAACSRNNTSQTLKSITAMEKVFVESAFKMQCCIVKNPLLSAIFFL